MEQKSISKPEAKQLFSAVGNLIEDNNPTDFFPRSYLTSSVPFEKIEIGNKIEKNVFIQKKDRGVLKQANY